MMIGYLAYAILLLGLTSARLVKIPIESADATSSGWGGVPGRVFDGNTDGRYGARSCYHSANPKTNSVTAVLKGGSAGAKWPVRKVKIYNRIDRCCDQRLNGAKVFADNKHCGTVRFREGQRVYEFDCRGHRASRIIVAHNRDFLQICEIEVFAHQHEMRTVQRFANVALRRPTRQSSTGWRGASSRAVDGNQSKDYGRNSCTHTRHSRGNWWEVDLPGRKHVNTVVIHNRKNYSKRIDKAQVWVHDGGRRQLCGTVHYNPDKSIYHIKCNKPGNKVRITQERDYLTLCEVEVMARA